MWSNTVYLQMASCFFTYSFSPSMQFIIYSYSNLNSYIDSVVFLQLTYLVIAFCLDFGQSLVQVDVGWFLFRLVVLLSMLHHARRTQGHQALFFINLHILYRQKLVRNSVGWYAQNIFLYSVAALSREGLDVIGFIQRQ